MRVILIFAVAVLVVAISGCPKPGPKAETPTGQTEVVPETPTETGQSITWLTDLDKAMAEAKQQNKPMIVDFWATWCGPCKMMEETTWPDPKVVAAAKNFIMVKQDVDKNPGPAGRYKVEGVPTLVFLSSDGKETHRQVGAVSAAELTELMKAREAPAAS